MLSKLLMDSKIIYDVGFFIIFWENYFYFKSFLKLINGFLFLKKSIIIIMVLAIRITRSLVQVPYMYTRTGLNIKQNNHILRISQEEGAAKVLL